MIPFAGRDQAGGGKDSRLVGTEKGSLLQRRSEVSRLQTAGGVCMQQSQAGGAGGGGGEACVKQTKQ